MIDDAVQDLTKGVRHLNWTLKDKTLLKLLAGLAEALEQAETEVAGQTFHFQFGDIDLTKED